VNKLGDRQTAANILKTWTIARYLVFYSRPGTPDGNSLICTIDGDDIPLPGVEVVEKSAYDSVHESLVEALDARDACHVTLEQLREDVAERDLILMSLTVERNALRDELISNTDCGLRIVELLGDRREADQKVQELEEQLRVSESPRPTPSVASIKYYQEQLSAANERIAELLREAESQIDHISKGRIRDLEEALYQERRRGHDITLGRNELLEVMAAALATASSMLNPDSDPGIAISDALNAYSRREK
jgi:hypothetical protein